MYLKNDFRRTDRKRQKSLIQLKNVFSKPFYN